MNRFTWFKGGKPKRSTQDLLKALEADPGSVWIGPAQEGKSAAPPNLALATQWAEQLMAAPAPGDGVDPFDAVRPADPYAKQTREVLAALLYAAQVAGVEPDQVEQWARTHSREPGEVLRPHATGPNPDADAAFLALTYVQTLPEQPRTEVMGRVAAALTRAQHP